ncbi:hypothetical protein CHUAL_011984 [Chamberlinius hualienensis]
MASISIPKWSEALLNLIKKFDHVNNAVAMRKFYKPFFIDETQVGLVRPDILDQLAKYPQVFIITKGRIEIHPNLQNYEERSDRISEVLQDLRKKKCLKTLASWRNECAEVRPNFEDIPLMKLDRCSTCLFGIKQFGVDINGYVRGNDNNISMWIQRRAYNKQTWPGKLDNMVSGGIAVGYDIMDTVRKEAAEEASIPPHLIERLQPAGAVTFYFEDDRGLFLETEFVFDLELPPDFIPKNADGEVEDFQLLTVEELKEKVVSPEFKTTSCPVTLDFLIRHGIITPNNESNYSSLVEKLRLPLNNFFGTTNGKAGCVSNSIRSPSRRPGNQDYTNFVDKHSDDSSSPVKVTKRKRESLVYSSGEDSTQEAIDSVSLASSEDIATNKKQVKRFKNFFSSPDKPKNVIKTYSRTKVEKKKIILSDSEDSNEAIEEDSQPEVTVKPKEVSFSEDVEEKLDQKDAKLAQKSKSAKTIASFFGGKISESGNVTNPGKITMSSKVTSEQSPKAEQPHVDEFNPSKRNYHPIDDACWKKEDKVPYLALCKTLEIIENTSARLKMIEILSNFLRSVIILSPADLTICVYLCLNKLAPDYEGMELGVGDMVLIKAIAQTTGKSNESIKSDLASKGDLGLVAESCRSNQRTMFALPKLTTRAVYDKMRDIAQMTGHQSTSKKVEKIQSLLVACQRLEARYLIRSLIAVTLTPPAQQVWPPTILDASQSLSKDEFSKTLESNTLIIKSTYCECPSYDSIIPVLLKEGISELSRHCKITPGMLHFKFDS